MRRPGDRYGRSQTGAMPAGPTTRRRGRRGPPAVSRLHEVLGHVVVARRRLDDPDPDVHEAGIEDVGAMARAVHQRLLRGLDAEVHVDVLAQDAGVQRAARSRAEVTVVVVDVAGP